MGVCYNAFNYKYKLYILKNEPFPTEHAILNRHNSLSIVEKVQIIAAFAPKQKPFRESVSTNICVDVHAYFSLILIEPNVTV